MSYRVVDTGDLELARGTTRLLRRALGVNSFGVNLHEFPAEYDEYPEHAETDTNHEELYVCLRGTGAIVVDGERVELVPRRCVVVTPESRRKLVAGSEGLDVLAIGAPVSNERGGWDDL